MMHRPYTQRVDLRRVPLSRTCCASTGDSVHVVVPFWRVATMPTKSYRSGVGTPVCASHGNVQVTSSKVSGISVIVVMVMVVVIMIMMMIMMKIIHDGDDDVGGRMRLGRGCISRRAHEKQTYFTHNIRVNQIRQNHVPCCWGCAPHLPCFCVHVKNQTVL